MKTRPFLLIVLLALVASVHPVAAQNTIIMYQGRVLDNGTNFSGIGLFQFALVAGTNANQTATATATNPISGFITTINVTFGGSGYITAPPVTIAGGGGAGATATAVVSGGSVIAVNINPGGNGSGYTSIPTVTIAPPLPNYSYATYWSNDGTSTNGSEPAAAAGIGVTNGLFSVGLGDTTIPNMAAISAALFNQPNLQLQIWFNDGVHGFAALSPAQSLTPTPYAVVANSASNLLGILPAAQLSGTVANGALPASPNFSGAVTATTFAGNGTNLTSLNANNLNGGTVPLARLSGITSSQLDAATWQLATNLNGGSAALASNVVSGISLTNAFITGSIFAGNGGGLTSLNAAQLVSIGNTNTGAGGNFFVGPAGNSTMTGYNNTGAGLHALNNNLGGIANTAVGLNALLSNATGANNTGNGAYALQANIGGNNNTASGEQALYANTNGANNTASGINALYTNTSGSDNTAAGAYALQANTSGFGNTAVGHNALYANSIGSNNIALGFQAGQAVTGSSNIDIGNTGFSSDANFIRIGSGQSQAYIAGIAGTTVASGVAVYVNPSGQLGVLTSSAKFKQDIKPMNDASDVLLSLHPVTFKYRPAFDVQGIPQFGLIAEEVEKVDADLVAHDDHGGIFTVRYEAVNAMLLNEFLKQHRQVETQKQEIEKLKQKADKWNALDQQNNSLVERLGQLEALVKQLATAK